MDVKLLVDKIKDRYLTWKTGDDKEMRIWKKWREENIVYNAHTIQNMFTNFKYIIEVNPHIFFDYHAHGPGWIPCADVAEYMYPAKPLGENAVWMYERGVWDYFHKEFSLNSMGDKDCIFVATNNSEDAIVIALKWS
jgi:hypothetical protein